MPAGQISRLAVQPHLQKYSASPPTQINFRTRAIPAHTRGAFRDRHGRWARDAVDAAASARNRSSQGGVQPVSDAGACRATMLLRTAKSCGPDASTLASSFAEAKSARPGADQPDSQDDGDKKARSPGRSRSKPLKPLRGECRLAPVNLW